MAIENVKFEVDVTGIKETIGSLSHLPVELRERIQRKALRNTTAAMLATAKTLAPKRRGEGSGKSISTRFAVGTKAKGNKLFAFVRNKAPHAHLMEYGFWLTKGKFFQKKIKFVGSHPPGGFMRAALVRNAEKSVATFKESVQDALRRMQKRAGRGA